MQRVDNSLPNKCFRAALDMLEEAYAAAEEWEPSWWFSISLRNLRWRSTTMRLEFHDVTDIEFCWVCLRRSIPSAMDCMREHPVFDRERMSINRLLYDFRQQLSPFTKRLQVHPRTRVDHGTLELAQLFKLVPVDALVTLIGAFASPYVSQKRGLKRRYGSIT